MDSKKTSSELKSIAKGKMMGRYSVAMGALLLIFLMSFGCSMLISMILIIPSTINKITFALCSIILSLLFCIFAVGVVRLFLNMSRNLPYGITDIFYGFTHRPDKVLGATSLIYLMILGSMAPYIILINIYAATEILALGVIGLLLGIAGGVYGIILSLRYSQVYYLLAERPELTVMETLSTSKKLMEGNKGRYFYLIISFFGWIFLSVLSCYVGLLWLIPYIEMTMTSFYQDLTGEI